MSQVILHVISSLRDGGAQRALKNIVSENPSCSFLVLSLTSGGIYRKILQQHSNVEILSITGFLKRFISFRLAGVSVIVGWMYHGALVVYLVRMFMPSAKPVITYRQTIYDLYDFKFVTRLVIWSCRFLNNLGSLRTVYVASTSKAHHEKLGFDVTNSVVIRNGFELPDVAVARRFEGQGDIVRFVSATRFTPQKRLDLMLRSFAELIKTDCNCRLYLYGEGFEANNTVLTSLINRLNLSGLVILCGRQADALSIYGDKHFYLQTSSMEGVSNSIGEAMSWGVVPICSDVGDNKLLVADLGFVFSRTDHDELQGALISALKLIRQGGREYRTRSESCRGRIGRQFSSEATTGAWRAELGIGED